MAEPPTDSPASDAAAAQPPIATTTPGEPGTAEANEASPAPAGAEGEVPASAPSAGEAAAAAGETGEPAKPKERKASRRKTSLKKKEEEGEAGEASTTTAPAPAGAEGGVPASAPAAGEAAAAAGETGEPAKPKERRASRRKTSLKKKEEEDEEEEVEVPKIIYPIDQKIQETLRKAWALFTKKAQKKKTEIAELDIPTVMRSIAINPTEAQVKEVIANTKAQDVTTVSRGFLTYECFEQRMAESFQLEPDKYLRNSNETILAALHTISGGANEMNAAELKKIMMTKGDNMTEQEAALMIRNAGDRDTGKVYVDEYADVLWKDGIPQPPPDPTVW